VVEPLREPSTLVEPAARADVAVTAAGMTAYELACAGVPFLALIVADNQERVGRALEDSGVGLVLDVRGGIDGQALEARLAELRDPSVRERLATAGARAVDGAGALRATSALTERWGFDR
jgi:spore coat polysaccharide biosynthesis predicted glycosyltransferase SpsG